MEHTLTYGVWAPEAVTTLQTDHWHYRKSVQGNHSLPSLFTATGLETAHYACLCLVKPIRVLLTASIGHLSTQRELCIRHCCWLKVTSFEESSAWFNH